MRVAVFVAEGVVLAVVGHPSVEWAFDGKGSRDGEHHADPGLRLIGAVCEVAVESDGDTGCADAVEDQEQSDIDRSDETAPCQRNGSNDRGQWYDDEHVKPEQMSGGLTFWGLDGRRVSGRVVEVDQLSH